MTNNSENRVIRPIHYLGSKLRMLETIKDAIDFVDPSQGTICDLFSGSGTVSKYMTQFRNVISVDIQHYSSILCEASINLLKDQVNEDEILLNIKKSEINNLLQDVFGELLKYESKCLICAKNGDIDGLYEIIEKGSLYIEMNESLENISNDLKNVLSETITNMAEKGIQESTDTMIVRYYGGLYFSYKQAVELDNIARFAFRQSGLLRTKLIAALLSTTSEIVNTVGKQFAQPLKVKNSEGKYKISLKNKILQDRSINTYDVFRGWLCYYLQAGESKHFVKTITGNYTDSLKQIKNDNVKAVYADPPYTRYHYSRYYHVLETICLRDNPIITTTFPNGKGGISRAIYREGRHQSPFCIKSQADDAFEQMFKEVKELNVPLILSYSPFDASKAVTPRLRTIDQLIDMAKRYYSNVQIKSPGAFTHSKLNSSDRNLETNHEAELLIICY